MLVRIMTSWDGGDVEPDSGGFVHLSWPDQVAGTIQRYYGDATSLTFLVLDEGALRPGTLRVEETGHGAYPHLYARLPAAAVFQAIPWRPGEPVTLKPPG